MDDINSVYDSLYGSTYCINARTRKLYLLFMKPLIERYLADTNKNYTIYVSIPEKIVPVYQAIWPNNPKLQYVLDTFVPTNIPENINAIYFYHQAKKPSKDEQISLANFMESHPTLKYVYVGWISGILHYVRTKLFKYYLHFEVCKTQWCIAHARGVVKYSICRTIGRKYYSQKQKKLQATNPITIFDYFIFHNLTIETSKIIKFNKQIFKPKNKKPNVEPVENNNTAKEVKIKYIYTNSHHNPTSLIMPDGTRENFNQIVEKYKDVIEI